MVSVLSSVSKPPFKTDYSIGITTFIVSVTVLLFWFPLKQKPGIATILNAILISAVIDLS